MQPTADLVDSLCRRTPCVAESLCCREPVSSKTERFTPPAKWRTAAVGLGLVGVGLGVVEHLLNDLRVVRIEIHHHFAERPPRLFRSHALFLELDADQTHTDEFSTCTAFRRTDGLRPGRKLDLFEEQRRLGLRSLAVQAVTPECVAPQFRPDFFPAWGRPLVLRWDAELT